MKLPSMHALQGSSQIKAVGHDGAHLFVTFVSGLTYRYRDAGAQHVEAMRGAESPGRYFNQNIRGQHPHEKLGEEE